MGDVVGSFGDGIEELNVIEFCGDYGVSGNQTEWDEKAKPKDSPEPHLTSACEKIQ
jgi:hypothetical protein